MSHDIPIVPLVDHYGGRVFQQKFYGWARASCPLPSHDDQHASAQVSEEKQRVRCLACNYSYDAIDLVRAVEGLGFRAALARAQELVGGEAMTEPPRRDGSLLPARRVRTNQPKRRYSPPWLRK